MRPQSHDLWPDEIRLLMGAFEARAQRGDEIGLELDFERFEEILHRIEASSPVGPLRLQVARSYLDLSFLYQTYGRPADSARTLERSRSHWQAAVDLDPDDFYARTSLAACHNLQGLKAVDSGNFELAHSLYQLALTNHADGHNRQLESDKREDPTDVSDNIVHRAGVFCNIGHLFRLQKDTVRAETYYSAAIKELEYQIMEPRDDDERKIFDFETRNWEWLHGAPHFRTQGQRFLKNARWGLEELRK